MPSGRTDSEDPGPEVERKRRLDRAFQRLLELSPASRARRLRELDRTEPRLAGELRKLLLLSRRATSEFEHALDSLAGSVLKALSPPGEMEGRSHAPADAQARPSEEGEPRSGSQPPST